MPKGRKPLPQGIKDLHGNPGKRKPPANALQTFPDIGRAPRHLSDEAKKEWKRMVDELGRLGILASCDKAALAAYCQIYGRWVEAEKHLATHSLVVRTPSGYAQQNPYLPIANRCIDQMRQFLTEFGMTPSSRTRIHADTGVGDALESFLTNASNAAG